MFNSRISEDKFENFYIQASILLHSPDFLRSEPLTQRVGISQLKSNTLSENHDHTFIFYPNGSKEEHVLRLNAFSLYDKFPPP